MRAGWLISGLVALAFASVAQASVSISYAPETGVVVVGSDLADRLHFERHDTQVYLQQVNMGAGTEIVPGPGCTGNGFGTAATCETGSTTSTATVHLGAGDDALDDTYGIATTIFGEAGNDEITPDGPGPVTIMGGDGNDTIQGSSVGDHLYGGTDDPNAPDGNDTITAVAAAKLDQAGSDGNDVISGGLGNDTIAAGIGADTVTGDGGDDTISGGGNGGGAPDGDDTIDGGAGNDTINGRLGADRITGGEGDDVLTGDDDSVGGGPGFGTGAAQHPGGNDVIGGGPGNDRLAGGPGDDALTGDEGDDTISGGEGADTIDAGAGADRIEPGEALMNIGSGINGAAPIPGDDGVADNVTCGSEIDAVFPATGDVVSTDCENTGQELTCPSTVPGSCPVTMETVLTSDPPFRALATDAAKPVVIGGTIVQVASGTNSEAPVPLTARGLQRMATAGRYSLQTKVTVRSRAGKVLSTRTVPYALDTRTAGIAAVPRTADVLKITSTRSTGRVAVTVDVPAPGSVAVSAVAKSIRFGSARVTAAPAGRRRLVLRPSARALRDLRKRHRALRLAITLVYTPARPGLGVASTRAFAATVKPPKR